MITIVSCPLFYHISVQKANPAVNRNQKKSDIVKRSHLAYNMEYSVSGSLASAAKRLQGGGSIK
jgi:hypothetical protein